MRKFDWLLAAHFAGDFSVQTDEMAKYKATGWSWMLRHVGVYLAIVTVVLVVCALAHPVPLALIVVLMPFLAASNIIPDRRTFVEWWTGPLGASPEHPRSSTVVAQVRVQANR